MTKTRGRTLGHLTGCTFGPSVWIHHLAYVYGCEIGEGSRVGPFVEIQKGVTVGAHCKIQSHSFLCEGVTLEDDVFVGHGVMFTNDRHPYADADDWLLEPTLVGRGASIGSGAVILPGVRIGPEAMIGAGAVVVRSVGPGAVVVGNPARELPR